MVARTEEAFGPIVAARVLDQIARAFELLAEHPGVGHRREGLTRDPRTRFWAVGPTLIAYRPAAGGIEVLLVERGEIDWEAELLRRSPT